MITEFFKTIYGNLFGRWTSYSYGFGWKDDYGNIRMREKPWMSSDKPITVLYQKNSISNNRRSKVIPGHLTKLELINEFKNYNKDTSEAQEDMVLRELDLLLAKKIKNK